MKELYYREIDPPELEPSRRDPVQFLAKPSRAKIQSK